MDRKFIVKMIGWKRAGIRWWWTRFMFWWKGWTVWWKGITKWLGYSLPWFCVIQIVRCFASLLSRKWEGLGIGICICWRSAVWRFRTSSRYSLLDRENLKDSENFLHTKSIEKKYFENFLFSFATKKFKFMPLKIGRNRFSFTNFTAFPHLLLTPF